ncbi:MAG: hypothetical protein ACUVQN_02215 [Caldisericia bacterium]
MEKYELIKKELKNLNLINLDGISDKIINNLMDKKLKKKDINNIYITLTIFTIGVILISFLGKKLWKK